MEKGGNKRGRGGEQKKMNGLEDEEEKNIFVNFCFASAFDSLFQFFFFFIVKILFGGWKETISHQPPTISGATFPNSSHGFHALPSNMVGVGLLGIYYRRWFWLLQRLKFNYLQN